MSARLLAIAVFAAAASGASAYNSRIVYIGSDPGYHYTTWSEGATLISNSVVWAGGAITPNIAYVEEDTSFGGSLGNLLTLIGQTGTLIAPSALASTNLSGYDVLLIGATSGGSVMAPAATNVQNFVSAGGGLIVEAEIFDSGSWAWLPYASVIGHSGSANIKEDAISITDSTHPVMANLSVGGLANWENSVHSNFATPGAGGFVELARDVTNERAYIIARDIPAPASGALLGLGGLIALRRRR